MVILDSHTHVGVNWFSPVETLLLEMNMNGVAGAVLVQHAGSYDNSYLFECDQRFPGRFKVCVLIDPDDPKPEAELEKLKHQGAAGLRLRPEWKFKTADPYAMFKRAGELGMVVSLLPSKTAPLGAAFKSILDACPATHFQLEHFAGAGYAQAPYKDFKEGALDCAKWPNTSIKVPGFGEIVPRPPVLPKGFPYASTKLPPLYDMALEAFGPQRMTFASDYSASGEREGYRNCLEAVRTYPAFQKDGIADWVLGKATARIWGFKETVSELLAV